MKLIEEHIAGAHTADDVISVFVSSQYEWLLEEQDFITFVFEMFVLARRNDDIAKEFAQVLRGTRALIEEFLAKKRADGVLRLAYEPSVIADLVASLIDGIALRVLGDPDVDVDGLLAAASRITRQLVTDG